MPFDGNGSYSPPTPYYPAITGTTIEALNWNRVVEDLAAGISKAITRDGQSPAQANISMGGNKLTNLAAAVLASDAMRYDQRYAAVGGAIAKAAYTTPQAIAAAPTTAIVPGNTNIFTINLNQNITLDFGTATPDGQTISIRFLQDATGGRTVTFPSTGTLASAAGSIDVGANKVSWLTLTYTAVAGRWEGSWMTV